MKNWLVYSAVTDGVPVGDPQYSGDEHGAKAYAKEHGGVAIPAPDPDAE